MEDSEKKPQQLSDKGKYIIFFMLGVALTLFIVWATK
jgi:hypothetical protein